MSHIAVFIAKSPELDSEVARQVEAIAQTDAIKWLSPQKACEISLSDATLNEGAEQALRTLITDREIDLAILPKDNRRKKLLIADMDSTMIDQECIDELADKAGVKDCVSAITAKAMNGEIDFEGALKERVALLKGLPETIIETVIEENITLAKGGKTLVSTMRNNGAYTALVSGGFTTFTSKIAASLGFDTNRANRLLVEDGHFTGNVAMPILGAEAKVTALQEITAAQNIDTSDAIAVGDGANDLPMLQAAGLGIALHAKPSVAAVAPIRLDHTDLTSLLYIQGYQESDFTQ